MHALSTCVLFFQELPRVLLPVVRSFGGGEEGVQVAATWRLLLPQAGTFSSTHTNSTLCVIWHLSYCCNSLLIEPAFMKTASFWILCCLHSQLNAHVVCCILMKHSLFSNTSFSRSPFHLPLLFTCLCVYFCSFAVFFSLYTSILVTSVFLL